MKNESGMVTASPLNMSNVLILYPSLPILYHFCNLDTNYIGPFSNQYKLQKDTFDEVFNSNIYMDWSRDLFHSYQIIIAMIVIGVIITLVYIILLKYL